MPRSPWLASPGCTKNAGVPVEAKGRRDLAGDMAGLAHAGDDDAAFGPADQFGRGNEGAAKPVTDRGGHRGDPAGFSFKRAQRRIRSTSWLVVRCRLSRMFDFAMLVAGLEWGCGGMG